MDDADAVFKALADPTRRALLDGLAERDGQTILVSLKWQQSSGTAEQIDRYLRPALRGELHDAYAVTEAEAGSDPSRIATTARKTNNGWVIDGEKWFVTTGDIAAVDTLYATLAKVTPETVRAAAQRLLDARRRTVAILREKTR